MNQLHRHGEIVLKPARLGARFCAVGSYDERRILIFASGAKGLVTQNSLTITVTCQTGKHATLVQEFATTLLSFPSLQQVTITIPRGLEGCGQARLQIAGSEDSQTFFVIR